MIPYCIAGITLLIAVLSIVNLILGFKSEVRWPYLLLSLSMAVFISLYGAWVFLSVYLKYLFALCYAGILVGCLLRKKSIPAHKISGTRLFISLVITILFTAIDILYFTGTTGKPYGIAHLQLPFKKGKYIVFQGGKGLPSNVFHYGLRGAVFAMDIAKLNSFGNRASNIFSSRLEDYEIYNDTIYSSCSGKVKHTADNNPDNIPPARKRGPKNTNHVLIETDSMYVFMAHLKYHEVFVQEGQQVQAGQPLGLAGNSGFSLEPHLHIQAHANTNSGIPWYKEKPLWIEFDGRSYLLFDVINANRGR